MIHIQRASLSYGSQILFNDISLTFAANQRIGVLGHNGTGKSTLLKILAGLQHFDSGQVTIERHKKIAYMPQEMVLLSDKIVFDEAYSVFTMIVEKEREIAILEKQLATMTDAALVERYSELQSDYSTFDAAQAWAHTEKILKGLGFSTQQCSEPVAQLSVGWKMRLVLAKL